MRDVTLEAIDDDMTIVEEVRSRDFCASDENLRQIGRQSHNQASSG